MAMTPSQLSIIVKSQGIEQATKDLDKLAKAAASVDAETKSFVIAQSKLAESNQKVSKSSEATARGVTTQELAMIKLHEAANKMNAAYDKSITAQERLASAALAKTLKEQETSTTKAEQALTKHNKEIDNQSEALKKASNHGTIWNNTLKSMATAALAYMGVNFAMGVIKEADAWAMMQSKLQLATGSMERAKVVQKDLFDLSQRLRVPLEDSAKLYTRMSHPLAMMGKSATDTMGMVESLGLALKLSGATGQEASSAMLQFSQSMNAGRLNGGEFNSIAEASPNILRAIETELRRTGQWGENTTQTLKKMGSEGKITGELLYRSLSNALPQFRKDFESLPLTFDGAMERLKNAWLKAVGEMGQETKFSQEFAKSIGELEKSLPPIAEKLGKAFNFIAQNLNGVILGISTLVGIGLASWAVEAVISLGKLALGIKTLYASTMLFIASPLGVTIAALAGTFALFSAGMWAGYKAMEALSNSSEGVDNANAKMNKSTETLTESIAKENVELQKQLDLMKHIKSEKGVASLPKSTGRERLEELDNTIKNLEKFGEKLTNKPLLLQNNANIIAQKKAEYAALEEVVKANEQLSGTLGEVAKKKADAIYWEEIAKKYDLDKAGRMKAEIEALDKKALGEEKYAMTVAAIRKKFADNTVPRNITPELTNLDKVNKLLAEQITINKEWEQDSIKKLTAGERFKIQVEAENKSLESILASGMSHNKLLTDSEKKQARKTISVNKEAIAQAEIAEAMQRYRELDQADNKRIEQAEKTLESEERTLEVLKRQQSFGEESKIARQQQSVIEADIHLTQLAQNNVMGLEYATAVKTLKVRQDTLDAMKALEAKDSAEQEAKKYEDAYQAANKKISDGLYNAIGKGSESAIKKLIQDVKSWFARLVLQPIIDPISKFGASIISPNAASAQGSSGNIMEMGSTIYKSITSGFADASAAAGSAFSSMALSSFGEAIGLSSTTAASAMAAEAAALTGSTIGASATSGAVLTGAGSAGASMASMMPYVAAAVAAFQGVKAINGNFRIGGLSADAGALLGVLPRLVGMADKVFAAQTVTGNLGTNNLSRNQAWTQEGGLLRSDRADTWKYMLSDSTATTSDGKRYTDTANLEADKALLNQLTNMYSAVKVASSEYAKALGLNADSIKTRTDAINFTFGKTAEETSANISKAFEAITNSIAKDLLGNLSELALQNESSAATMGRLATNISSTNAMFKALNYSLFSLDAAGIKAADSIVTLFGGLDKFQAIASSYYDNFYNDIEKTKVKTDAVTKALKDLGKEMPTSREAFRLMVEQAKAAGNNELFVGLMKVSSAFAEVVQWADKAGDAVKDAPEKMDYTNTDPVFPDWTTYRDMLKESFNELSQTAQKWLSISKQASDVRASINTILWGNSATQDAAVKKSEKLWKMMSSDITVEQKLSLAGELKDAILSKYQLERDSVTKLIDFSKQLRTYVDSLKLGNLSPLTMTQKLAEARRQYETTLAKAQAGDTTAQGALTGSASAYLEIAKTAYASSDAYQAIFMNITSTLESMTLDTKSAEDKLLEINKAQEAELIRLVLQLNTVESVAASYYSTTIQSMSDQLKALNNIYKQMGVFDGVSVELSGLPAEIAAALSGTFGRTSGEDYVKALYSKYANKTGNQIDKEGMQYWTREFELFGREYVLKAFQDSVAKMASASSAPFAPAPMMAPPQASQMSEQIVTLKEEIKKLREDAQLQTIALMETLTLTSKQNADRIVEGTTEGMDKNNPNWNKATLE